MSPAKTAPSEPTPRLRQGIGLAALLLGLALAGGIALSARTRDRVEPRIIALTARDMAFYREGDPTPNPTLVVRRGEEIRLTLVNRDLGMTHDFALESLDVATRSLREIGASASVVFEAPGRPGEAEYVCTLHDKMMRGILRVE